MSESSVPDENLGRELDEQPYSPATGQLEPPLILLDDQGAAALPPQPEPDMDAEWYNPASGQVETPRAPAVEEPF